MKKKDFNGENGVLPRVAIVNGDCPFGKRIMETTSSDCIVFWLPEEHNDFRACDLTLTESSSNLYW